MRSYEASTRLNIAMAMIAGINSGDVSALPISLGELADISRRLRAMKEWLDAQRPNPGLYTEFAMESIKAAVEGGSQPEYADEVVVRMSGLTARQCLQEMGAVERIEVAK